MKLSQAKILLVDSDGVQPLIAAWLQALGITQVTRAHGAAAAAEALEWMRWDLVIVDCDGPDRAGLRCLEAAGRRSSTLNRDTPLIMLASADDQGLAIAQAFSDADCLLKPLGPRAFCAAVTGALMPAGHTHGPEPFGDLDARLG
jgi:DNA-binding response OmpR family regulator